MNIELFEIEDGVIKPTVHCHTIKWLKEIMEEFNETDSTGNPYYLKVYEYIFYMTCPDPAINPYFNMPEDDREDQIIEDIELTVSTENAKIQAALERAAKMYETPTLRAYQGISKMLDNLSDYMGSTQIIHGKDGNISALIQAAKSFQAIRDSFKGVRKDLEEEQKNNQVRGGGSLAYDQEG